MIKVILPLLFIIASSNISAKCLNFNKPQRKIIKNYLKELRRNNVVLASYCIECGGYKVGYTMHESGELKVKKDRETKSYTLQLNGVVIDLSTVYVGENKDLNQLSSIIQCGSSKLPSSINLERIDKIRQAQKELNSRIQTNKENESEMYALSEVLKRTKNCGEKINKNLDKGILDALKVKELSLMNQIESDNHRKILSPANPWGSYINLNRDIKKMEKENGLTFIDRRSFQRKLKVASGDKNATLKMFYNRHTIVDIENINETKKIQAEYDELGNLIKQASIKRTQYTQYRIAQNIEETDMESVQFGFEGLGAWILHLDDLPGAYNIDNLEREIINLSTDYILTKREQEYADRFGTHSLAFKYTFVERYKCRSEFNTKKKVTYEVISE